MGLVLLFAVGAAVADTHEVTLNWDAPDDGAPVASYRVFYSRDGGAYRLAQVVIDNTAVLEIEVAVEYVFYVKAVSEHGVESIASEFSDPVYIPEQQQEDGEVPPAAGFQPNFPNPFNPETTIRYGVPDGDHADGKVLLEIYDVRGQLVRRLPANPNPGWHEARWDGRNENGTNQPSGNYVVRLVTGAGAATWKMTMIK